MTMQFATKKKQKALYQNALEIIFPKKKLKQVMLYGNIVYCSH